MGWQKIFKKAKEKKLVTKFKLFILNIIPIGIFTYALISNPSTFTSVLFMNVIYIFIASMVAFLYFILRGSELAGVISLNLSYVLSSYIWALAWAGIYSQPPCSGLGCIAVAIVIIFLILLLILFSLISVIFYYAPLMITILNYHGNLGKFESARRALVYILIVFFSLHYTWFFLDYYDFLLLADRVLFVRLVPALYLIVAILFFIWLITLFFYFKEGYPALVSGLIFSLFLRCHLIAIYIALVVKTGVPADFWYRGFLMLFYNELIIGIILILCSLGPRLLASVKKL